MSICRGIAGRRGKNPVGIFIHNGADGQNATTAYYRNYLQNANLENGFAHYYVCSDGILQAEDDENCAWHCGYLNGNLNFLSIEREKRKKLNRSTGQFCYYRYRNNRIDAGLGRYY